MITEIFFELIIDYTVTDLSKFTNKLFYIYDKESKKLVDFSFLINIMVRYWEKIIYTVKYLIFKAIKIQSITDESIFKGLVSLLGIFFWWSIIW